MGNAASEGEREAASAGTPGERETFSLCLNVAGIDPHKVTVNITGRKLEISGQHIRKFKQGELGITRYNYCGFSNELRLPPNLDLNTLSATITDDSMLTIQAHYYDIGILVEMQDKDDEFYQPITLPVVYKYNTSSTPTESNVKQAPFWTPCLLPIPGTRCDNQSSLVSICHHEMPGSLCNFSPNNIDFSISGGESSMLPYR